MQASSSHDLITEESKTQQQQRPQPQSYLLGAIIGDIIGSRFENMSSSSSRRSYKTMDFTLITPDCHFTDDTILTIAIADALIHNKQTTKINYESTIRKWANQYPNVGYGKTFVRWMKDATLGPYNSWGNGSAMRVSSCGYLSTLEDVLNEAKVSAECTHNHPEGIKGAQATAACIFLARNGRTKDEIRNYITSNFGYDLNRTIDSIRPNYAFDVSCQGSVPESIIAFLDSDDYESTIRLAVSLGGDTDTQAAIAGSIAQAYYNEIDPELVASARAMLDEDMLTIVDEFNSAITNLHQI